MPRLTFPFVTALLAFAIAVLFTRRSPNMATKIPEGQAWADGPCALVHTPVFETKKVGLQHRKIMRHAERQRPDKAQA